MTFALVTSVISLKRSISPSISVLKPISTFFIFSMSFLVNFSLIEFWIRNRFGAIHTWPALAVLTPHAKSDISSISTSSRTMKGSFPPSSRQQGANRFARVVAIPTPTSVLPVIVTASTPGLLTNQFPTCEPLPVTTCSVFPGTPASNSSSAIMIKASGLSVGGFMITALPAAKAGATL